MAQTCRMRPRLPTGSNRLLGQPDRGFLRTRPTDEPARVTEDTVVDPRNLGKLFLLQAAPRLGQRQPLAEGVGFRRDRAAIPGRGILVRVDDEQQVAQTTLEDGLLPRQFMIENDDAGISRLP